MHPYREREGDDEASRGGESPATGELAIAIAVLLVGALLLAIGLIYGHATEAGLGAAALLFGVYALVTRG
ncbi:MAG TPA: hypothetical protein VIF62_39990 [Labilithrix sp.]|jgi:hypothetical protein